MASNNLKLAGVGVTLSGRTIFRGVDLELQPGECVVILGPSGCGKTTLLRAIVGDVAVDGIICAQNYKVLAGRTPPNVTFVTQAPCLWDHLTVLENVSLVRQLSHGEAASIAKQRAGEWLALLEVQNIASRYPHSLSGGEQQRVALARGLAAERPILLLDEVTSNVDVARRSIIVKAISESLAQGRMVLFVTHDLLTVRSMPYTVRELTPSGLQEPRSM